MKNEDACNLACYLSADFILTTLCIRNPMFYILSSKTCFILSAHFSTFKCFYILNTYIADDLMFDLFTEYSLRNVRIG